MRQRGRAIPCAGKLERRHAADPPPGCGRRRDGQRILAAAPPAPQHQGHRRIVLGGELEAAGGGHAGAADLADHRREAAMAQAPPPSPPAHPRRGRIRRRSSGWAGGRPEPSAGANRSRRRITHNTMPFCASARAAIPAANKVAAASSLRLLLLPAQIVERGRCKPPTNQAAIDGVDSEREIWRAGPAIGELDCTHLGAQGVEAGNRVLKGG